MSILFYCGSGSPYAWRVWLALEHKRLPYELKMLSFSSGDLRDPAFAALNPRRRVPVIVDGEFSLYESSAILEYLEDAWPGAGSPLFPAQPRPRAVIRRLVREADAYLAAAMETMVEHILFTPEGQWDSGGIDKARNAFLDELPLFERNLQGEFFAERPGAADLTVYPMLALALRMEQRKPDLGIRAHLGRLAAWMRRVEALPYFERTVPPHWKQSA